MLIIVELEIEHFDWLFIDVMENASKCCFDWHKSSGGSRILLRGQAEARVFVRGAHSAQGKKRQKIELLFELFLFS